MSSLSRRDFLKLGALSLGGLAFTPFLPEITAFEDARLARVATSSVSVYKSPSDQSQIVATWNRDDLIHVYEEVAAEAPKYNPVWYRVWGGYMHRARLQKVRVLYNEPLASVSEKGQLAEVTVPYTQSYRYTPRDGWQPLYRLYYETTHWIVGVETGPDGQPWYRLLDELLEINYSVPAIHLRPFADEELAPLSPDVPFEKKRIEVSIATQTLFAYENDLAVFQADVSTGLAGLPSANNIPTVTPKGRFNIEGKMPSKHMGDGSLASDLVGVPWNCFFTDQGHAFHGTYWHDNFGVPMSHGCVNMRMADAKWLFRWTRPLAAPVRETTIGYGTMVHIY
jgi:hypothetical protein